VAYKGTTEMYSGFVWVNLKLRENLENLGEGDRLILKFILKV
jgi:hypothetical protein